MREIHGCLDLLNVCHMGYFTSLHSLRKYKQFDFETKSQLRIFMLCSERYFIYIILTHMQFFTTKHNKHSIKTSKTSAYLSFTMLYTHRTNTAYLIMAATGI